MSPWWEDDFRRGPKAPPPAHGLKVKKPGTTWWGQRWLAALESISSSYSGRLERGKTYARTGRVHDLVIHDCAAEAKVTGSSDAPYDVEIRLEPLDATVWAGAIQIMASQAQFAAALLEGQMPKDIDSAFTPLDASLFPRSRKDLSTRCDCPDSSNPCKHLAAVHYVLGDAFDRDPFLLFELRGRTRDDVLTELRKAWGAPSPASEPAVPSVKAGRISAADYDAPRAPLPSLALSFDMPRRAGVIEQLGAPPQWPGKDRPASTLGPLLHQVARTAKALATEVTSESGSPRAAPAAAPAPSAAPAGRRTAGTRGRGRPSR